MNTCTIIIPVYKPNVLQKENLQCVVRNIVEQDYYDVLVVEQCWPSNLGSSFWGWLGAGLFDHHRVKLLPVIVDSEYFNPSVLVNAGVKNIDSDYIWVHDLNMYLDFSRMVDNLKATRASAIKPFGYYYSLNKAHSASYLRGKKTFDEYRKIGGNTRSCSVMKDSPEFGSLEYRKEGKEFGKKSYIVKTELFKTLRGLNEDYVGWADPGFEFARRLFLFIEPCEMFCDARLLKSGKKPILIKRRRNDKTLIQSKRKEINNDVYKYIEDMSSSLPLRKTYKQDLKDEVFRETYEQKGIFAPISQDGFSIYYARPGRERAPADLPGEIWGVVAYFNPAQYKTKLKNYRIFSRIVRDQGLKILTVELAGPRGDFSLAKDEANILLQRQSWDILWQKERLLNLGIENLPSSCDKVVWLDADVIFENSNWVSDTAKKLEDHSIVQPFSTCVRLKTDELYCNIDNLPFGYKEHQIMYSSVYARSLKGGMDFSNFRTHGHTGFAWAARREEISKVGLYDANILGNGDANIAGAILGDRRYGSLDKLSDKAIKHVEQWSMEFVNSLKSTVSFVPGNVSHLWHGDYKDKQYDQPISILHDTNFDPKEDLRLNPQGVYTWNTSLKPSLFYWCKKYFFSRKEDG